MGFFDDAIDLAHKAKAAVIEIATNTVSEHVRRGEAPRTLFLSDWVVTSVAPALANLSVPEAEIQVTRVGPGYRIGGLVGAKAISALIVIRSIRFSGGTITVEVETPEGISLEARPFANFFVSVIARIFGGNWLGGKILSAVMPPGLVWDGTKARYQCDIKHVPSIGKSLVSLEANVQIRRGEGGLLLELDDEAATDTVRNLISTAIVEIAL